MTGKLINLRQARKTRHRAAAKQAGDENAVRFGRTKAEKAKDDADAEKAERHLDQHRREE